MEALTHTLSENLPVAGTYLNTEENWLRVSNRVNAIERQAFGTMGFDEEFLKEDFIHPDTTVVLLKDNIRNELIGYTYAKPVMICYPEDDVFSDRPLRTDTAYIFSTAICKEEQGKGYVGILMKELEYELWNKGFRYLERDAAVENGYADKIRKVYKGRIIKEHTHDSEFGKQVYFRIRLLPPQQ
jgi:hypothetical protein